MRETLLAHLSELIYKHYKIIVVLGLVVTALMAWCASRLELRLSMIELLDPNSVEVKRINYANTNFGGLSLLFVIVQAEDPARVRTFADDFASRLMKHPAYVKRVLYKVEPEVFIEHALLYLDEGELKKAALFFEKHADQSGAALKDLRLVSLLDRVNSAIEKQVAGGTFSDEDARRMKQFTGQIREAIGAADKLVKEGHHADIGDFQNIFVKNFVPKQYHDEIDLANPYNTDPSGRRLLMLVRASRPTDDFKWNTQFMEVVENVLKPMKNTYPDVKVEMTGNMAVMRDERRVIRRDMKVVTAVTFIGVLLLFAIGFRGMGPLGMVILSLGMGITWTFGLTYLIIGYLNVVTSVFGSIILGMGIDYAILILTRYTEERARGLDVHDALRVTMTQTGKGIITGAVATAGAFYAMGAGTFRAADQMALIAGNGIFIYCTVMMTVLPSIMVWRDVRPGKRGEKSIEPRAMIVLARFVKKAWPGVLAAGVALFALLTWKARQIRFEYDYTKIEAKHLKSMELLKKMPEMFGWGINYGMVFTHGIEQDREYAKKLRLMSTISKVQAISDFIPANQDAKLKLISRIRRAIDGIDTAPPPPDAPLKIEECQQVTARLEHLRAMLEDLETLASLADEDSTERGIRELGVQLDSFIEDVKGPESGKKRRNLGYLQHRLASDIARMWERFKKMTRAGPFTIETLPSSIRDHFTGADGAFCIYAFPRGIIWNEYFMERNVCELKAVSPEASGISVIFQSILMQVKHDFLIIGVAAFMAVFGVLLFDYRNAYLSLLTMVPLVAGAVMMVGSMVMLGIKLNFVNMAIVPLIMGIGIDYGVYMVHRWLIEGRRVDRIETVIRSTGRGVVFSALTTIAGFGSLSLASYQGLQSLGEMLVIGIAFCLGTAVVGLPALFYMLSMIERPR